MRDHLHDLSLSLTLFNPEIQKGDIDLQNFLRQGPSTRGLISPRGVALDALLGYVNILVVGLFVFSFRVSTLANTIGTLFVGKTCVIVYRSACISVPLCLR